MTVGLITCGALGKEVVSLIKKHEWDAEVIGLPAINHTFPERIAPQVEGKITAHREEYQGLIVVYGDCGSKGELDRVLQNYPEIERLKGPHCYEMYAGQDYHELLDEEPGTFFLTDFMVRTFQGLIIKSMGLDRYPELKEDYFRNYQRVVYLAQQPSEELRQKAHHIADYLDLPLRIQHTGFGALEDRLARKVAQLNANPHG